MPVQIEYSPFWRQVVLEPIIPSLIAGGVAGSTGFLTGGLFGIVASTAHPVLYSTITTTQFFALGTSFYYTRSALSAGLAQGRPTQKQELIYSTIGGAVSGGLVGAWRSRSNIIPSALMMGALGFVGQKGIHAIPMMYQSESESRPLFNRIMESRWTPMKSLSNDEYEAMLKEKLLRTEAEIAIVEERLAALRSVSPAPE